MFQAQGREVAWGETGMKKKGSDFLMVRVWFCLKPFSSSGDTPLKASIKNRAEEPCVVTGACHPCPCTLWKRAQEIPHLGSCLKQSGNSNLATLRFWFVWLWATVWATDKQTRLDFNGTVEETIKPEVAAWEAEATSSRPTQAACKTSVS